jgi:hypothetical protein
MFRDREELLRWIAEGFADPCASVMCTDCSKIFKTMEEIYIPEDLRGIYCEKCYQLERMTEIARLKQDIEDLKNTPAFGKDCYLYVIYAGDGIHKIGISNDPISRMNQIQIGNHRKLRLAVSIVFGSRDAARFVKKQLHDALSEYRTNGEWFNVSPQILGTTIFECLEE